MSERTTYRQLLSPLAQLEAAKDFMGQMESVVADEWRESDSPKDRAKHEDESAQEFLGELYNEGFHVEILSALRKLGLRFEIDGEEEGVGYFHLECKNWPHDLLLHQCAYAFSTEVCHFAPEGWTSADTLRSLGWENLILVPDDDRIIVHALKLLRKGVQRPS